MPFPVRFFRSSLPGLLFAGALTLVASVANLHGSADRLPVTASSQEPKVLSSPQILEAITKQRTMPVPGAKPGSFKELSRVVDHKDWNALGHGGQRWARHELASVRRGGMMVEPCLAPGTPPSTGLAYQHVYQALAGKAALQLQQRWTSTATNPSVAAGEPFTLTWSLTKDGSVEGDGSTDTSNVQAWAIAKFGSTEALRALFRTVFARWEAVTGVHYVEVDYDDGASVADTVGQLGVRADIRIGGKTIDGNSNVLAYNYYPMVGDMFIDTSDNFFSSDPMALATFNTVCHEHGHGLGLAHTCPINQTKLMEPYVSTAFNGPQLDDILAVQYHYGDANEHGTRNNTLATATNLGTLGLGATVVDQQSINASSTDLDYFKFAPESSGRSVRIDVKPLGAAYLQGPQKSDGTCSAGTLFDPTIQRDLNLQLLDASGNILAQANSAPAGGIETISSFILPGTGPFTARVVAADSTVAVQGYSLTITETVSPPNNAPTAADDAVATKEDTALSIEAAKLLKNDSSGESAGSSDAIKITGVTAPSDFAGTLSLDINAQTILYTPTSNFHGVTKFSYTVTDSGGLTASATVTISVASANDAPVFPAATYSVSENHVLSARLAATDDSEGALTFNILVKPRLGTLTLQSDGAFIYTPKTNFNGTDSFTARVADLEGKGTETTLSIKVSAVNGLPLANDDKVQGEEDSPLVIPASLLLKNDSNGEAPGETDPITIVKVTAPATLAGKIQLNVESQTLTFTPKANFNGETSFAYTIQDSGAAKATATVTIQVKPVNDAPVADTKNLTAISGTPVEIPLTGSDIDGDSLTFAIKTSPKNGIVKAFLSDGVWKLRYTSNVGFTGADPLTIVALDAKAESTPVSVNVKVAANRAPQLVGISPNSGTFASGATVDFVQNVRDSDGISNLDAVAFVISDSSSALNIKRGMVVWFDPKTNEFILGSDDGKTYSAPEGVGGSLSNSQVQVSLTSSNVTAASDAVLTLKWHVVFKPSFTGSKSLWARAEDRGGLQVGFSKAGAITIGVSNPAAVQAGTGATTSSSNSS